MTTLLTITHDPEGKQVEYLAAARYAFDLFGDAVLVATPKTSPALIELFREFGYTYTLPIRGMAQARRDVLKCAVNLTFEGEKFFYCDLDRLLYWMHKEPGELTRTILDNQEPPFTVIGRTQAALETHPPLQYETERAMNRVVKITYSLPYDFFAGARLFDASLADIMLKSTGYAAAIDVEWPLLVKRKGIPLNYVAVNGLAYESEFLDIERLYLGEVALRTRNLASVLDFIERTK